MSEIFVGWIDVACIVFLLLSMTVGLARGVVFEVLSLLGWLVAYLVARWGTPFVQPLFHGVGDTGSALNYMVAFACVFLVTRLLWGIAARAVRAMVRSTPLSGLDRLFGAAFGALRGVVVLLIVAAVVGLSPWSGTPAWHQSQIAAWLNSTLRQVQPIWVEEPAEPSWL